DLIVLAEFDALIGEDIVAGAAEGVHGLGLTVDTEVDGVVEGDIRGAPSDQCGDDGAIDGDRLQGRTHFTPAVVTPGQQGDIPHSGAWHCDARPEVPRPRPTFRNGNAFGARHQTGSS